MHLLIKAVAKYWSYEERNLIKDTKKDQSHFFAHSY